MCASCVLPSVTSLTEHSVYLKLRKQRMSSQQIWKIILAKYLLLFWVWRNYLPTLSAKVRKEKRNLIWSIGKRIIGLSWQTTDLFQQHVNGITTLLLCKDCLRQGLLMEWTEHFCLSRFLKHNFTIQCNFWQITDFGLLQQSPTKERFWIYWIFS